MATIDKQLEIANKRYQLAKLRRQEHQEKKYQQFLNKNLASSTRRKNSVSVPDAPSRDMSAMNRSQAMAMARQMVEENPVCIAILLANLNFVVGNGFNLSVRTKDKELNKAVESSFKYASKFFDIRGYRSWYQLLRCWHARKIVDGDVFIKLVERDGKLYLSTIEADRCWKNAVDVNDVGIDFDDDGRAKTYYFGGRRYSTKQDNKPETAPYPANDVIPLFSMPECRAERERGVSMFLQVFNLLKDIEENLENMDLKIKAEAFLGLVFKRTQPDAPFQTDYTEGQTNRPLVKLTQGLNLNLDTNETVEVLESKNPRAEYLEYIRYRMRMAGVPFGVPLEFFLMDTKDTNYSGMQVLGQLFKKSISTQQSDLMIVCSKVFERWLDLQGYTDNQRAEIRRNSYWKAPSVGLLNILTEATAIEKLMNNALMSRQDALTYMGSIEDFETTVDQIADEQTYLQDNGVAYAIGMPGATIANVEEDNVI